MELRVVTRLRRPSDGSLLYAVLSYDGAYTRLQYRANYTTTEAPARILEDVEADDWRLVMYRHHSDTTTSAEQRSPSSNTTQCQAAAS